MAIADVYDALSCKRHYKEAFAPERVRAIMVNGRGSHFDPRLLDAFLQLEDVFLSIAEQYRD
jgi:putative two-component system response regulator